MIDHHESQIWRVHRFEKLRRESDELRRANRDRRHATPLKLNRVVDTPRRTSASIADTVYHKIRDLHDFVEHGGFGAHRHRRFLKVDRSCLDSRFVK
jgi:hypothetical protein